jgi:hypothetical protein
VATRFAIHRVNATIPEPSTPRTRAMTPLLRKPLTAVLIPARVPNAELRTKRLLPRLISNSELSAGLKDRACLLYGRSSPTSRTECPTNSSPSTTYGNGPHNDRDVTKKTPILHIAAVKFRTDVKGSVSRSAHLPNSHYSRPRLAIYAKFSR